MKWIYLFFITTLMASAQGSLVQQELHRSRSHYNASDHLMIAGRTHYVKKNYVAALNSFEKSIEELIKLPFYANRMSSYTDHLGDATVAVSVIQEREGKKESALKTVLNAFKYCPDHELLIKRLNLFLKNGSIPVKLHLNKVEGYMLHHQYEKAHETLGLYLKLVKAQAKEE